MKSEKRISELDEKDIRSIASGRFWRRTRIRLSIPTFGLLIAAFITVQLSVYYRITYALMLLALLGIIVHSLLSRRYQGRFLEAWREETSEEDE